MSVMDRLAKLLPLLATDKVGELTNAAGHINRLLTMAKVDWHDIVQLLKQEPEPADRRNRSPLETDEEALVRLASAATYFLSPHDEVFADINVHGHRETMRLDSQAYLDWLMRAFFTDKDRVPTNGQMKSAVRLMRATTCFSECPERHEVHLRSAEHDGKIYLDLGDDSWRVVEISSQGWQVVQDPPVRFRRTAGMQPLPLPERGGTIAELFPFMNVEEAERVLLVTVVLDALRAGRPHPVLFLAGGEGTVKSTTTNILASLVDPHKLTLRALPTERDLAVAASNQSVLCFDNVRHIPPDTSDQLCRLSSGAGYAKRKNYTDDAEFQVGGSRPILINGIQNCIDSPDLADRAIVINLRPIAPAQRRTSEEVSAAFTAAHPRILGTLLDIAAHGLANLPRVRVPGLARIADFQRWAIACETGFTTAGTFQRAFNTNISDTVDGLLDGDPVAQVVAAFMASRTNWEGTAAQLWADLIRHDPTEARITRQSNWPRDPARLGKQLRTMLATLAKAGVAVEFGKALDRSRTRMVTLRTVASPGSAATPESPDNRPHIEEPRRLGSST